MSFSRQEPVCRPEICALIRGIKKAGSPWHLIVAAYVLDGPRRFNEILQMGRGDSLNSRTLSRALKRLVGDGFVRRGILTTQPFGVECSLTSLGEKLRRLREACRELD